MTTTRNPIVGSINKLLLGLSEAIEERKGSRGVQAKTDRGETGWEKRRGEGLGLGGKESFCIPF